METPIQVKAAGFGITYALARVIARRSHVSLAADGALDKQRSRLRLAKRVLTRQRRRGGAMSVTRLTNLQRAEARRRISAAMRGKTEQERRALLAEAGVSGTSISDISSSAQVIALLGLLGIPLSVDGSEPLAPVAPRGVFNAPKPEAPKTEATTVEVAGVTSSEIEMIAGRVAREKIIENNKKVKNYIEEKINERIKPEQVYISTHHDVPLFSTENEGTMHSMTKDLLFYATNRNFEGDFFNVQMIGPAGAGKTFAAMQVARILNIPFFLMSVCTEESHIRGYVDINGTYQETQFSLAFASETGGILLLDEMDAWQGDALLAANAALANGKLSCPNATIRERPRDLRIFCATNTSGMGADEVYSSRNKLDGATISRFPVALKFSVDEALERKIISDRTGTNPAAMAMAIEVQAVRKELERIGAPPLADSRTLYAACSAVALGRDLEAVRRETYLSRLDDEQRAAVIRAANKARNNQ